MASIEEVWGAPFPTRQPMNKAVAEPKRDSQKEGRVYASPQERTHAAVVKNRKTIDDLSRSLPIVQNDDDAERNFQPQKSHVVIREDMTNEFPYAPPSFQSAAHDMKLNRILHMIEQNKTGYERGSAQDMLLYVFTGIFFLYTLDTFVTLGKTMR
jgi:hypothetical protein